MKKPILRSWHEIYEHKALTKYLTQSNLEEEITNVKIFDLVKAWEENYG